MRMLNIYSAKPKMVVPGFVRHDPQRVLGKKCGIALKWALELRSFNKSYH